MPAVNVNVGGQIFQTTLETLSKIPSISQNSEEFVLHAEIFVDRDPEVFKYILNFARDGRVILPDDNMITALLYQEAKFYGMNDLVTLIAKNRQKNAGGYCDLRL